MSLTRSKSAISVTNLLFLYTAHPMYHVPVFTSNVISLVGELCGNQEMKVTFIGRLLIYFVKFLNHILKVLKVQAREKNSKNISCDFKNQRNMVIALVVQNRQKASRFLGICNYKTLLMAICKITTMFGSFFLFLCLGLIGVVSKPIHLITQLRGHALLEIQYLDTLSRF